MLIQIGRAKQTLHDRGSQPSTFEGKKPGLLQAFWGGLTNLVCQRPVLAIFQACLRCNSSCGYCNLPLNVGRYEMSREEIRQVFTGLYREGVRFVFMQGGEPLLRKDLVPILQDLVQIGFHITLITNGTRLTESLVQTFDALAVTLSISLDTLDPLTYERIRGADQLDHVLAGLKLLEGYRHPKFLTCIVSEINRQEVTQMVRFAQERGFLPVVGAYHWDVGLYGKQEPLLMYEREQARAVFEGLLKENALPPGYLRQYAKDNVAWLSGETLSPCDAGRYSIAIDASGHVSPCLSLPEAGNLLESSLSEILARFDRQAIQRCSDRSSCNRLDGRVIGSVLRHPIAAWQTPVQW
ncbi:MAG: radical SAM protein [Nitrospira sp.]|nr:radical SAM protein [Nitrospira sp.]MDH4368872.1 radical SAM protein [Nitrospira sp.]MDH5496183.1 radical SAM protein [Nitrospira sp.]MDH5725476.1 radical SAM protein [Nitrospira sp.]